MSSTTTDDQPEKQKDWQSSASLAQQNSAVSPLLDNIIGGAARFAGAHDGSLVPDDDLLVSDGGVSRVNAIAPEEQGESSSSEDAAEQSPNGGKAQQNQEESHSATLSASESTPNLEPIDPNQPGSEELQKNLNQRTIQDSPLDREMLSLSEQYGDVGLLAELNALAQTQQFQLEQHREYVLRSRAEQSQQIENWRERCAALEEQLQATLARAQQLEQRHLASQSQVFPLEAQRDAAQQVTERLQTEILDYRQRQATLEDQLDLAEATLREQQEISAAQSRGIVAMQAELSQAQAEVTALETRLSHQDHLRQQLKADGSRDRQDRSKARDRQLQLEQETTQMTGQLLRLSEELRQAQHQSKQWRRQAQTQSEQLRDIARWAAQAESIPPELMALLEPLFHNPDETDEAQQLSSEHSQLAPENNNPVDPHPSSLDLPNFPHGNV